MIWFKGAMMKIRQMPSPTRAELEKAASDFFQGMVDELDEPRAFNRKRGAKAAVTYAARP